MKLKKRKILLFIFGIIIGTYINMILLTPMIVNELAIMQMQNTVNSNIWIQIYSYLNNNKIWLIIVWAIIIYII